MNPLPLQSSVRKPCGGLNSGPGGLDCPCCRPKGSKQEAKRINARMVRRAAKISVRNEEG